MIYQVVKQDVITLVAIDVLITSILFVTVRSAPRDRDLFFSLVPTIVTSYVYLLGQQNILRQHIAFVFLICATIPWYGPRIRSAVLFIFAVLSHNATAILFGYWLDLHTKSKLKLGPAITAVGVFVLMLFLPVLGKSAAVTGLDTRLWYVAIFISIALFLLYANLGRAVFGNTPSVLNFFAFLPAMIVLSSGSFERIAMMFLVFITLDIYLNHRSLGIRRSVAGHIAYGALVVPVFLVPSAQGFLVT